MFVKVESGTESKEDEQKCLIAVLTEKIEVLREENAVLKKHFEGATMKIYYLELENENLLAARQIYEERYIEEREGEDVVQNIYVEEGDTGQSIEVEGNVEQYIKTEKGGEGHNVERGEDKDCEHNIEGEGEEEEDEECNIEMEKGGEGHNIESGEDKDCEYNIEGEEEEGEEHNIVVEKRYEEHCIEAVEDELIFDVDENEDEDEDEENVKHANFVVHHLQTKENERVSKRKLSLSGSKNKKNKKSSEMSTFLPGLTQKIYTIDDDLDFNEEEVTLPYKPLKIPAKFLPYQEMLRLKALHHATKGANEVYWSSPSLELHLRDITPIFSKAFTSANLIDAWAYFMMKDQESAGQGSQNRQIIGEGSSDMSGKSCFVISMIWTFLKSFSNAKIDVLLKNQLKKAQNDVRFIHFPMSSPGFANSSKSDSPNHWTLLVFDKHTNIWSFYNSLRPRTKDSKDFYFDEAMAVVKHAHKVMNEGQRKESGNSSTLRERLRVERVIDSPLQGDSTVDCGYIVMKIMECYAHNKPIPKQWTSKQMKEFKTDLLLRIVNDEHAVKPEEYLKGKTAQTPETGETSEDDVIFLKMV